MKDIKDMVLHICAKFYNEQAKDTGVIDKMVKCFDFVQKLREKQTDKLSYGGA